MKRFFILALFVSFLFPSFCFGAKRALLIGINDYENLPSYSKEGYSDLKGTVNDVEIMKKVLITYYGFSEKEIKTLINSEATREGIEKVFENWLVNGTSQGDLVVFYYSGHGVQVEDQSGDESDRKDEVLCPYDTVPNGGDNIILDDELGIWLRKLFKREVVVFIDACHSGTLTRGIRGGGVSYLEPTPAGYKLKKFPTITNYKPRYFWKAFPLQKDEPEDQIFMSASKDDQISAEMLFPEGYYGVFTYSLEEGLRFKKGRTYKELYEYVRKAVEKRNGDIKQTPQIEPQGGKKLAQVVFTTSSLSQESFAQVKPEPQKPTKPQEPSPPSVITTPTPTTPEKPPLPLEAIKPPPQVVIPQTPPEIIGERLLVAVEPFRGASSAAMRRLHQGLSRLPYIELVREDQFFDRLIRGDVVEGRYRCRFLNRIGDVMKIPSTNSIDGLLKAITPKLESAYIVKQLARISHPNPPFKVSIKSLYWDKNGRKTEGEYRDFRVGDKVIFNIYVEKPSYIYILNTDSKGNFTILYPNKYHQNNEKVEGEIEIPDEVMRKNEYEFQFFPPAGEETVKVIAITEKLNIETLDIKEFKNKFETISGSAEEETSPARNLARDILTAISSGRFEWSEDTIVVRSYE